MVLVNGGTAREAELVAGALQDNHRAILVGTKTFGESAIETLIPLNGNGAIRLTTARFKTPGGHAIQGKGLEPDLNVVPVKLERLAQGIEPPRSRSARRAEEHRPGRRSAAPIRLAPATPGAPNPAPPGQATDTAAGQGGEHLGRQRRSRRARRRTADPGARRLRGLGAGRRPQ